MKSTIEQHYPAVLAAWVSAALAEWVSAVLAEWVYEPLQIQVKESYRSQVQIPLGTIICYCYGNNGRGQYYGAMVLARFPKK